MKKYSFIGALLTLSLNATAMENNNFNESIKSPSLGITIRSNETLWETLLKHLSSHLSPENICNNLKEIPIHFPGYKEKVLFPKHLTLALISTKSPFAIMDIWRHILDTSASYQKEKDFLIALAERLQTLDSSFHDFTTSFRDKEQTHNALNQNLMLLNQQLEYEKKLLKKIRKTWLPQIPVDIELLLNAKFTEEQIMEGPFINLKIRTSKQSTIQKIIQLLPHNTTVVSLDVEQEKYHLSPTDLQAIGQALTQNKTLQWLALDTKKMTLVQDSYFINSYFNNTITHTAEPLANALSCSKSLRKLDLKFGIVSNAVMEMLSNSIAVNTSLTSLDISQVQISRESRLYLLKKLADNKTLKILNMTNRSGQSIRESALEIDLIKAIGFLLKNHPRLQELDLSYHTYDNDHEYTKEIAEGITTSSSLYVLKTRGCGLNDAAIQVITNALLKNPPLKVLDIGENDFTHTSVPYLNAVLQKNTNLTTLGLGDPNYSWLPPLLNKNGQNGASTLLKTLIHNPTLTTIDLGEIEGESCISSLIETLKSASPLAMITMKGCNFKKSDAEQLSMVLKDHPTLKALNFHNIKHEDDIESVGDEIIKPIAESLRYNTALTELGFGYSFIGDTGIHHLALMFTYNNTLTSLDISGDKYAGENKITDKGLALLVEGLKNNTSLLKLNLAHNALTFQSLPILAKLFKTNSTLAILDIQENPFGRHEEHFHTFIKGLHKNKTLYQIIASPLTFEEEDVYKLQEEFPGRFLF